MDVEGLTHYTPKKLSVILILLAKLWAAGFTAAHLCETFRYSFHPSLLPCFYLTAIYTYMSIFSTAFVWTQERKPSRTLRNQLSLTNSFQNLETRTISSVFIIRCMDPSLWLEWHIPPPRSNSPLCLHLIVITLRYQLRKYPRLHQENKKCEKYSERPQTDAAFTCSSDGLTSWVGKSFFRLWCVRVLPVRMGEQRSCFCTLSLWRLFKLDVY